MGPLAVLVEAVRQAKVPQSVSTEVFQCALRDDPREADVSGSVQEPAMSDTGNGIPRTRSLSVLCRRSTFCVCRLVGVLAAWIGVSRKLHDCYHSTEQDGSIGRASSYAGDSLRFDGHTSLAQSRALRPREPNQDIRAKRYAKSGVLPSRVRLAGFVFDGCARLSGMEYRIIYSIMLDLGEPPEGPPGSCTAIVVQLGRDGRHYDNSIRNGRDRHGGRAIDLRPGDDVLCHGCWRRIKKITAYRDAWLTAEQAARQRDGDGYLYRLTSPCEPYASQSASASPSRD